jgi:hypothetical protein
MSDAERIVEHVEMLKENRDGVAWQFVMAHLRMVNALAGGPAGPDPDDETMDGELIVERDRLLSELCQAETAYRAAQQRATGNIVAA